MLLSLLNNSDFIEKWEKEYSHLELLQDLSLYPEENPRYLKGDFFGDGIDDYVFCVLDGEDKVKIVFINEGSERSIQFLGKENDPFGMDDYSWAGIFEKVEKGDVLWSNYTEDRREFKDVPENEKVYLKYNALFMHAAEACGGGFVYWKDDAFHWLQQE